MSAVKTSGARQRILDAAYDLFSQQGIRAVGIDAIIERSGVARMTLYRHFRSKDELIAAWVSGIVGEKEAACITILSQTCCCETKPHASDAVKPRSVWPASSARPRGPVGPSARFHPRDGIVCAFNSA